ncbi:MAG: 30S ribosomal protein S12 methylthiotransferase RimO [Clostridia bacterium]|nr:30S ribosomal protein S12 methylthiotransferase RimO [Clostridia bacterium]
MAIKVGFVSLGCPKNQLDLEVMLGHLVKEGCMITDCEEADIVVINTCAFILDAKQESIDNILDIAWLKDNGQLKGIVVTGCMAEKYREEILKEMPEVDALLGTGSVHSIVEAVRAVAKGEKFTEFKDKNEVELGGDRIVTTGDAMAYLKISEGCDNNCTYCAIPKLRGKFRSRKMEDIITEAKEIVSLGVKELVVVGQDTTSYGIDLYGEYSLHTLLRRLAEETDVAWLRVLYCYPEKITDALIEEFATNPKLVKYIDIPVQHISDRILKRMNRKGNGALIRDVISKLRTRVLEISIRSTAIVGFPGETEEDFNELCEFVKEAKFDHFGAFTYSREENTPAYNFDDQIDEEVKQLRYDIIMKTQLSSTEAYLNSKIGKEVDVLCEGYDPVSESHYGRTADNAPEIDGNVFFISRKRIPEGTFVRVRIKDALEYDLTGDII